MVRGIFQGRPFSSRACGDVEERPFQGRVPALDDLGFSPCGRFPILKLKFSLRDSYYD